ncbi:MAG: DUF5678 domain-containing protein [Candidatus Bathyarchaeota archaeon]|nr:DUF5678 domain-containing protein [Candidatus Bathyarchaeota archaeon]
MSLLVEKPEYERELMKKLNRYSRDQNWIKDNYKKLLKKHGSNYIAVKNKKVIEVGENIEELIHKLKKLGEDPSECSIEFLTDKECNFLF